MLQERPHFRIDAAEMVDAVSAAQDGRYLVRVSAYEIRCCQWVRPDRISQPGRERGTVSCQDSGRQSFES